MSIADRKALTQRIFDTFNAHDAQAAAALFAADAVLEDIAVARPAVGTDAIAAVYARHFDAIPDAHVRVERMVAEGETVVAEWTSTGTHRGPLLGIPASGRAVSIKGVSIIRFRGATPIADTRVWDYAGLLRQIGLLPSRAPEGERPPEPRS